MMSFEIQGAIRLKKRHAKDVLETVSLEGFENQHPEELSGRMRQRVALARRFVYNPGIFLMDEPFAALNEPTWRKTNQELLRIPEEIQKTTVLVTHDIPEAVWLSVRTIVLSPRPEEIHEILEVDLPRPRDESTRHTDELDECEKYLTNQVMQLDVQ